MKTDMDSRGYVKMEEILKTINSRYIKLSQDDIRRNNVILHDVLQHMVMKMCQKNRIFGSIYKNIFYGGSYYDGLKVGYPDEYDIDLLLQFPSTANAIIQTSNKPGYVHVRLNNNSGFESLCEAGQTYLDITKVLSWIEGIVQLVLNDFTREIFDNYNLESIGHEDFYIRVRKAGPAFTLIIWGELDGKEIDMSVDLVPCFNFGSNMWPSNGFIQNPYADSDLQNFFVVPKAPKSEDRYVGRYWRLSFQKQERKLLEGKEKLKSAIKLLKKMRNTLDHVPISSYYLKTIALWETNEENTWSRYPLSYTFMHILKKYKDKLSAGTITYFWNRKHNLLQNIGSDTLTNYSNRLGNIIKDIERNIPINPSIVAKYLLTNEEHTELFNEGVVDEPPPPPPPSSNGRCTIL